MVETTATNNAAAVAEGGTKPESALAFTEESADVRKIATVLPVTDELFDDAPAMRSYVQGRLIVFLQLAEENQLLNGSGVSPNIQGILNNPDILTHAKGADTYADALYKAMTMIQVTSQLTVSGIALNPMDWQTIRLSKDTTGQYLFGSPLSGDIERIFGYPVVKTTALTQGTGLPGAWDLAAMILRRTGIQFAVATEHADFFIKNLLMLRVEERLAFPVFRPEGFCEVDFTT
jgi:HK97 family phage major capsid protein